MEISRKRFYQTSAIVVFAIVSLVVGVLVWQYWANQNVLIDQDQAIQNAIQACNSGYGLQPVEQPTEATAKLTTWKTAQGDHVSEPDRPVWVVRMKGRWLLVGGPTPPPDSDSEPGYEYRCTIIIDARTGESLSLPIE